MANPTSNYGRQNVAWPDLGSDPGSTLHGQITAAVAYLSNNVTARWSGSLTLAASATAQIVHNFSTALTGLKIFVVESGAALSKADQDAAYTFTQVDTNTIQVQNTTSPGVSKTFQVYIMPSGLNIRASDLDAAIAISTTGNITAANIKATTTLKTDDNSIELNSDATAAGTDYKATITRSGSQNSTATYTLPPATSTLASLAGSETFTNKTLTGAVVSDYEDLTAISTPSSPGSGKLRVYAKSDNKIYTKDSSGTETAVGSGAGSGAKNYLSKYFEGNSVVGRVYVVGAGTDISVTGSFPDATSTWYADTSSAATVPAGSFVVGVTYVISSVGTTDFVLIGASSNTVGVTFTATGVGSGTGQAVKSAIFVSSNNSLRGASNFLTALAGNSGSGDVFIQTPVFNIDGEDLGKALTVQFDLTGNTVDNEWDVVAVRYNSGGTFQELIPIAGNVSTITGTPSAKLPTGTTQFNGFFLTKNTASDVYSIRFRRRAGSADIRLDSLLVGPNAVLQGAIVTDWQSYTPVFTALGTVTITKANYRRVGNVLEGDITVVSGTPTGSTASVSLPTGLTVDGTLISATTVVGFDNNKNTGSQSLVIAQSGSPSTLNWAAAGSFDTVFAGTTYAAAGWTHNFMFRVPISQWQANTQMAARAVEEYAYNSSADANTNTTSFGYGIDGVTFYNYAPAATSTIEKRVRFQTPIQKTDTLELEVYDWNGWQRARDRLNGFLTNDAGSAFYGYRLGPVPGSNTDISVWFYSRMNAYETWVNIANGGWKWRVRKVSGGAAVGYPVGARNVVGDTTGTAVPAGYIGEEIKASATAQTASTSTTDADVTGMSITLTPGRWRLGYDVCCSLYNTSGSSAATYGRVRITKSDNTAVSGTEALLASPTLANNDGITMSASRSVVVDVTSSTTYKLRLAGTATGRTLYVEYTSVTGTFTDPDNYSNIWAIRIA